MNRRDLHVGSARPYTRYYQSFANEAFWLRWDVLKPNSIQVAYTVDLMPVYEHERELDRGRFEHYRIEQQEHVARITRKDSPEPFPVMFESWVNWLAEHNEQPWSVTLDMPHVHHAIFSFSFADLTVGTMFKLAHA